MVEYFCENCYRSFEKEFPQGTTEGRTQKERFLASFSDEFVRAWVEDAMLDEFVSAHEEQFREWKELERKTMMEEM